MPLRHREAVKTHDNCRFHGFGFNNSKKTKLTHNNIRKNRDEIVQGLLQERKEPLSLHRF